MVIDPSIFMKVSCPGIDQTCCFELLTIYPREVQNGLLQGHDLRL